MSVKYGLLGILAKRAQHGYELKRSFEQITGGFWQLNYGQIYQTLDRLEADGLVSFTVEHDDSVPDRKVYEITPPGREALEQWLAHPDPRPRPLRDELFIRLAVMADGDLEPLFDLLRSHRGIYLQKMSELTGAKTRAEELADEGANRSAASPADVLIESVLIDAALFHAEADLRWIEHCETRLRALQRQRSN